MVSITVIIINAQVVLPRFINLDDPNLFSITEGKIALILVSIFYFTVIIAILKSSLKPLDQIENSDNTHSNDEESIEFRMLLIENPSIEENAKQDDNSIKLKHRQNSRGSAGPQKIYSPRQILKNFNAIEHL